MDVSPPMLEIEILAQKHEAEGFDEKQGQRPVSLHETKEAVNNTAYPAWILT